MERAIAESPTPVFRQVPFSPLALGLVANFVSRFPPFDNYEFGIMMSSLRYQLEQKAHLVADVNDRLVAYLGWIETTRAIAEAWVRNDGGLNAVPFGADAVAVTILATESPDYIMPMIRQAKRTRPNASVFWKRTYLDGRTPRKHAVPKRS
ncbi:MAG: hypothetical protein U1E56_05420 [Bauldia sp.]